MDTDEKLDRMVLERLQMDVEDAWERMVREMREKMERERAMELGEPDREGGDRRAAIRLVLGWGLVMVGAVVLAWWAVVRALG